jgi:hypothetical protein
LFEIVFETRDEAVDVKVLDTQSMNLGERGEVVQVSLGEDFGAEPVVPPLVHQDLLYV